MGKSFKNLCLISSSFLIMGLADWIPVLTGFVQKHFNLNMAMTGLLPFMGLLAYGLFSIPAAILSKKYNKQKIFVFGLLFSLIGFSLPVLNINNYYFFLMAVFLLGIGVTLLQVTAIPLIHDISYEKSFSKNIMIAQSLKGLGGFLTPLLIVGAIVSWQALPIIYGAITLISFTFIFYYFRKNNLLKNNNNSFNVYSQLSSMVRLFKNKKVTLFLIAYFLYVGSEIGLSSWLAIYFSKIHCLDINSYATLSIAIFFITMIVGRGLSSIILSYTSSEKLLVISSFLAILNIACLFFGGTYLAFFNVILIGLSFSTIAPLIYAIILKEFPLYKNELSGLLCNSIVGGAILPLLMGFIAEFNFVMAFLVPLLSICFIFGLSVWNIIDKK